MLNVKPERVFARRAVDHRVARLGSLALAVCMAAHPAARAAARGYHGQARAGVSVPPAILVTATGTATLVLPQGWNYRDPSTNAVAILWDEGGAPVHSPRPDLNTAVWMLRDAMRKMTGHELPVTTEDAALGAGPEIHLGLTTLAQATVGHDLDRLDREGFVLLSTPGALLVAGRTDWGTIHGVADLLERYAGARWCFPGPLGEVIPRRATLVLENVNWKDEPDYGGREYGGLDNWNQWTGDSLRHNVEWQLRNRIRPGRYKNSHNLPRILDPGKFAATHTDWYPQIGGRRQAPKPGSWGWQPCVSAPGLAESVAREVIAYFDTHPDEESFSIANGDGGGWCECEACRALDGAGADRPWGRYSGQYSRRMCLFFNRVAEQVATRHPDRRLGLLAYSAHLVPPEDITLHPLLMPYITSARDGYYDPEFRRIDEDILTGWGRHSRQIGVYEYWHGYGTLVPNLYTRLLTEALRRAYDRGARGFKAEAYPNWGLDAPKLYINARVLWNLATDPEAALTDFCDALFGPASAPMRRLFTTAEEATSSPANPRRYGWFDLAAGNPRQFIPFTPDVVATSMRHLEDARRAAVDEVTCQRIEYFAKCYEMLPIVTRGYAFRNLLQRGAPMQDVLLAVTTADPVRERLVRHWRERKFGFELYPASYDLSPDTYIGGLVARIDPSQPQPSVTSELGRRLAREALDAIRAPADAAGFRRQFRAAVDAALARDLPAAATNAALATLRDEVAFWATRVAAAFRMAAPPVVDGAFDEPEWRTALRNRPFVTVAEGTPSPCGTDFAAAWDATHLYLAIRCRNADTNAAAPFRAHDVADVFKDETVEIFLDADRPEAPYHQIAVTRSGGLFDQRAGNVFWNAPGLRRAVQTENEGWSCELAIPWEALGMSPTRDRIARLNVVRNRAIREPGGQVRLDGSAWFLSVGGHAEPGNRGWLAVVEAESGTRGPE